MNTIGCFAGEIRKPLASAYLWGHGLNLPSALVVKITLKVPEFHKSEQHSCEINIYAILNIFDSPKIICVTIYSFKVTFDTQGMEYLDRVL